MLYVCFYFSNICCCRYHFPFYALDISVILSSCSRFLDHYILAFFLIYAFKVYIFSSNLCFNCIPQILVYTFFVVFISPVIWVFTRAISPLWTLDSHLHQPCSVLMLRELLSPSATQALAVPLTGEGQHAGLSFCVFLLFCTLAL